MTSPVPVVMTLTGNDPCGADGVQADIEAIASMGCHTTPVLTTLTVQDSRDIKELAALEPSLVIAQARAVLEDMPVAAIKIGLIGDIEILEAIHTLLKDYPDLPVVLDPVLAVYDDDPELSELITALRELLLPQTTVLTVNSGEARRLAPEADTLDACAMALLANDCQYVLLSGAREHPAEVQNILYGNHRRLERYAWQRLPHRFNGAGCTLSAAIAGLLAQGQLTTAAIRQAQEYTWCSLQAGYRIGMGNHVPNRLFWAHNEPDETS